MKGLTNRFFLVAVASLLLTSCSFQELCVFIGECNSVYEPPKIESKKITINTDTVLTKDYGMVTFVVSNGATLDCDNHKIEGDNDEGSVRISITVSGDNNTIKNCNINGGYTGISILSNLPAGHLNRLIDVDKDVAESIGDEYRQAASSNNKIINTKINDQVREGVYVSAFTTKTEIYKLECTNAGRMCIYLDHGSQHSLIHNSTMNGCGFNHSRGRECLSVDASSFNTISHNVISNAATTGIECYTNWGENEIKRTSCNNNIIEFNHIKDSPKGISIASRQNRNIAGCKGNCPDYAKFNIVNYNVFSNVRLPIEVLDSPNTSIGNTWENGEIID